MTFTTFSEFETSFKNALEQGLYRMAAKMVLDNKAGSGWGDGAISEWWIDWAKRARTAKDPEKPAKEQLAKLGTGDLFGEPLTTGKTRKTPDPVYD